MRYALLAVGILLLMGCGGNRYKNFVLASAEYAEERQLQSCFCLQAIAGGGFGGALNGSVGGFIATGGIDPLLCKEMC